MQYFILAVIAISIVVFVVWVAVVAIARLLGVILTIALVLAGMGFLLGVILGMIAPIRVLRGKSVEQPKVATPAAVRAGTVMGPSPKGPAQFFGWDLAWPLYVPYQMKYDQAAVIAETRRICRDVHRKCRGWVPQVESLIGRAIANVLSFTIVGIPCWGLIAGITAGTLLWLALTWVYSLIARTIQRITNRVMNGLEIRDMKKNGAHIRCTRCYNIFSMPSYECSEPSCTRIHRDLSPGAQGIVNRICECETELPLTVARASASLRAICPFCDVTLPSGSGRRRVVVVPVFGSVGAGKTSFLAASVVALQKRFVGSSNNEGLMALSDASESFLKVSTEEARSGQAPVKTTRLERPEGYPFLLNHQNGSFELHLMDAAGENFVNVETTTSLRYLDIADTLVLLIDPLAFDDVADQLKISAHKAEFQTAQGSADDAYGSVIERLRSSGADLHKRKLAVVVTKADAIAKIMPDDPLPETSEKVQEWLSRHGEDRLVARIGMDFTQVSYFAVASLARDDHGQHPLEVVDWTVVSQGGASFMENGSRASKEAIS
ncbi:hypothetical protein [Glutamicibacter sp. NPDC087344]|uniref:TRAFAC clade GTPase domain-containing protein n=1 Tax=Glutamicibacter sp. NPDC087344 TaxID=3363994 RepID=UPI003816E13A